MGLKKAVSVEQITNIDGTAISGLRPIDEEECQHEIKHPPSALIGHMKFCGIFFHVMFLRVKEYESGKEQEPYCDPHNRWADVCALDEIAFETLNVPGYEGDWVVWAHPGEQ